MLLGVLKGASASKSMPREQGFESEMPPCLVEDNTVLSTEAVTSVRRGADLEWHAHAQPDAIKQHKVGPMSIGCLGPNVGGSGVDEAYLHTHTTIFGRHIVHAAHHTRVDQKVWLHLGLGGSHYLTERLLLQMQHLPLTH